MAQTKSLRSKSRVVKRNAGASRGSKGSAFKRGPRTSRNLKDMDTTFLVLLGVLVIFGLIALSSASSVIGYQLHDGDTYWYLKHQLLYGGLIGGVAFFVMSKIDYHYWRQHAFSIAVVSIILLLAVFTPLGFEALGARRWIAIGGFTFQPSEVVKLSFLIYLAAWLEKQGRQVHDTHYGFSPFMMMLGALVLLIAIAQKDLGTTIVIAVISIVMYFIAGAPWKHLGAIFVGGVAAFFVLIKIAPYRAARLTTFLNPELDPQGIGYHINQALLAVGSGGFFGLGLGRSRQKFNYLPEVVTDSIYAIIAEELGFVVAFGLILLFLALTLQALRIAKGAPDAFGKYMAVGIATWIGFQAFVNIGAMLSLLPLTGITLPFISYGSTSMIMLMAAAGLLASISRFSTVSSGNSSKKKSTNGSRRVSRARA